MYDALIVGARCAGSPTAMLLARKGYRTLLVDRATFPSDMPLSTHLVHQPGVARLRRWGLLDRVVASNCPPIFSYHFDFSRIIPGVILSGSPPSAYGTTEAYAPRRRVLDSILVEAADAAGAEVRQDFTVQELMWEDGRVAGARGRDRHGRSVSERASIVIGADGMNSLVAHSVDAPEYNTKSPIAGPFFAYWSGVGMNGFEFYPAEDCSAFGWMTNDGLALVGVGWPFEQFQAVRGNPERHYLEAIDAVAPDLAVRIRSGHRETSFVGIAIRNFFRRPYGPGWALVGDAGYQKDPSTAMGISDAFRCAELLASAVDAGLSGRRGMSDALSDYERERNEKAMPLYDLTCQLATLQFSPEVRQLLKALRGNQEDTNRFFGLIAQTTSPPEFFAAENIQRILARAVGGV